MARVAISVQGIEKWFGEGEARTHALRDVTFDAYFGEMLFIAGPSGSGKTTLLSVISGILRPDGGRVMIEGIDVWSLGDNDLATFRLARVGFVANYWRSLGKKWGPLGPCRIRRRWRRLWRWRCRRQAVMVRICRAALRRTQRLMTVVSRETCAQSSRMAAGPVQDVALGQRLRPDSS